MGHDKSDSGKTSSESKNKKNSKNSKKVAQRKSTLAEDNVRPKKKLETTLKEKMPSDGVNIENKNNTSSEERVSLKNLAKISSESKKKKNSKILKKSAQRKSTLKAVDILPKKKVVTSLKDKEPSDAVNIENKDNISSEERVLLKNDAKTSAAKKKINVLKEVSQKLIPEPYGEVVKRDSGVVRKSKNGRNIPRSDQFPNKSASNLLNKMLLDRVAEEKPLIEPYDEGVLFLTDGHKSTIDATVICLKSDAPFCFLGSEFTSYLEYYKEIVIGHLKGKEEITLLYFDPKFGDDLSGIINKELKDIDISFIGSSIPSMDRKILIIDNEKYANNLDWELIDSLRLELKSANIGVFGVGFNLIDKDVKAGAVSVIANFKSFDLPKVENNELKKLNEYISERSDNGKLSEIIKNLSIGASSIRLSGNASFQSGKHGIWHKFRKYILRK